MEDLGGLMSRGESRIAKGETIRRKKLKGHRKIWEQKALENLELLGKNAKDAKWWKAGELEPLDPKELNRSL